VGEIINWFKDNGKKHERLGRTMDRVGMDEFKGAVVD